MGEVARWTGQTWTTSRVVPRGYANWPQSLSRATSAACVMTDQSGNAWVRH